MPPRKGHPKWGGKRKRGAAIDGTPISEEVMAKAKERSIIYAETSHLHQEVALKVAMSSFPGMTVKMREEIIEKYDPIKFLGQILKGNKVNGLTWNQDHMLAAAKILANKVMPDLRVVETPMSTAHTLSDYSSMTDMELIAILKRKKDGNGTQTGSVTQIGGRRGKNSARIAEEKGSEGEPASVHPIHDAEFHDIEVPRVHSEETGTSGGRKDPQVDGASSSATLQE